MRLGYHFGLGGALLLAVAIGVGQQTGGHPAGPNGGGGDTITSPNSSLNVGGTATNTTLDLNLANANVFTVAQTMTGLTMPVSGTNNGVNSSDGNHRMKLQVDEVSWENAIAQTLITLGSNNTTSSNMSGLALGTYNVFASPTTLVALARVRRAGNGFTDVAAEDVILSAPAGNALRLGTGATSAAGTSASAMQIIGQAVTHTVNTIASGATPAITTASLQTVTLTANATPTVTIVAGEHLVLRICQDATGGWTWAVPASMHGAITSATIAGMTPGNCAAQAFDSYNGTTLVAENTGIVNVAP